MKRKPKQTTLRQFDFFEVVPVMNPSKFKAPRNTKFYHTKPANMDPLCRALMDCTEAEFYAMFETPSGPDEEK